MQLVKSKLAPFAAVLGFFALAVNASAYDLVSEAAGVITFTPENLLTPLIACLIAAVTAGLGLYIIGRGVGIAKRWAR